MHVWHMDSYDKLARWGFRVHGAIDGAMHFVLYMHVAMNKTAVTIFEGYRHAIARFGHPLMIRSDYAGEHRFVQRNMERARPNSLCFRTGSSIHNQRIEAFWRHLRDKATQYFKEALLQLSFQEGLLQIEYPLHRYCMVAVFLPLIREAVDDAVKTWNAHTVRRVRQIDRYRPSHIPQLAFQAAEREAGIVPPPLYVEGAIVTNVIEDFGLPYVVGWDYWNDIGDSGNFEEGILDLHDETLRYIRDTAFATNQSTVDSAADKLQMHLLLSIECQNSVEASMGLGNYVQSQLLLGDLSPYRLWTLNTLQQTLQIIRDRQNM
ncbi:unnamed protein product [Calypogeia fissa]